MRTLLVALLAGSLAATAVPLAAQDNKSAPDDVHLLLTRQHRFAMTFARRVEGAEAADKDDAVVQVGKLGDAIEAAGAQLDELAKLVGATYATQIETIRKREADAKAAYDQAKAAADAGKLAGMKAGALAARTAIDAAEDAHQAMMKAMATAKPDTTKPAAATSPVKQ